jgi:hypothetical protein
VDRAKLSTTGARVSVALSRLALDEPHKKPVTNDEQSTIYFERLKWLAWSDIAFAVRGELCNTQARQYGALKAIK